MNRIYQGRVTSVQTLVPGASGRAPEHWETLDEFPMAAKAMGEELLFKHHALFQDAVNYYIVALAALGTSPGSKLTKLRGLLGSVWEVADKKGQRRQGMRESLQRAWNLPEPPTLAEAIERFTSPIIGDGIPLTTTEKAAEYLLFKLGGETAIRDRGRDFFPMFCDVESEPTYKLSASRRGRADDEQMLQRELHRDLTEEEIQKLAASITLASVVNLQPGADPDTGDALIDRLRSAAKAFAAEIDESQFEEWLRDLDGNFSLPKRRGGNINVERVDACTLFLAFPCRLTKFLFQGTFSAPKASDSKAVKAKIRTAEQVDESSFIVDDDDPIKLSRGKRGCVFVGFTALPIWKSDGRKLSWKEFDIAAFKEALKVYNQFQQNVERQEDKLNGFATRLLVMDGERAIEACGREGAADLRVRLEAVWNETKGKPQLAKSESGDEVVVTRLTGDPRIERLRQIINDDLAEEYRLTDGVRTAYGLRRRTMKGWSDVKRKWQSIVKKGVSFSEEKRRELKAELDKMRGGEKREQIGSHKLFEALIVDEAAWSIWRHPDDQLQEQIAANEWASDPLEAFREYCELRETMVEVAARQLNFTPADPRFSRRLFLFTDACSFGKDGGLYKHDLLQQAVTVPVAVKGPDGKFSVQPCRLSYSAPRMLRDQIRGEDGSYAQDWTQPMMRALFGEQEGRTNPQELKEAAVQLMPDYDAKGTARVLLNFPLDLEPAKCWEAVYAARGAVQEELFAIRYGRRDAKKEKALNGGLWESNIRTFWESESPKKRDFLLWPSDEGKKQEWSKGDWWNVLTEFRVMAADLGTRHAASIALLECGKESGRGARFIGRAGDVDWFARYQMGANLRLPGENAVVLRPESSLDGDGRGKDFREELYGDRGRPADDRECREVLESLAALRQPDLVGGITDVSLLRQRFSFPELNDKLLVAMRRAQNWIATCISWHWKLTQPENSDQRGNALAQLLEQERMPEWKILADGSSENLTALRDALHVHISNQRQCVQGQLLKLTDRILPLRGRGWEWIEHPDKADCHLLRPTVDGRKQDEVKLRGQRGLSMARIEQLSELRRRWQSLNQSLRRQIGEKPLTASEMRNDPIPDPCPDVLRKLENIRKQRVNQTAHLILAQALGLKLRTPEMSEPRRRATDTHGEYVVARPPVDFIVLEDLSRYLSDQGRAKSENTRLMKWCHRAILNKVKMLAEPFGIPVLETPAAYSSRFCSLTGSAGFRAAEVGWDSRFEFRWRVLLDEAAKAESEGKIPSENAAYAAELFRTLERFGRPKKSQCTLIAPQPGGPMFVTFRELAHPAPSSERKQKGNRNVLPMQADLNAAANLALRAVGHPGCASVHHRLRTERKKGAKDKPDAFLARESRRFGKDKVAIFPEKEGGLPKERNTNLFYDEHRLADFGRARLESDAIDDFSYASGPGLWKNVNNRELQWHRCMEINRARIQHWENDPTDDIP